MEQDANARAYKYFVKRYNGFTKADGTSRWDKDNPIIGYNWDKPFDDSKNQLALKYAKLKPAWHDWVLGPNICVSGLLINNFILNRSNRYHEKLDKMIDDGFTIDDWLYDLHYYKP
jgi:hypothetical protein